MQRFEITGKVWFTSDLHFNHKNIIKYCNRPFTDINDMENQLINNWNSCVDETDIVFVLGDFIWFNHKKDIIRIINKLNGIIYLVPGNHDDSKNYENFSKVIVLSDIVHLKLNNIETCLSHYPLRSWQGKERGAYNLFGHIHSNKKTKIKLDKNQFDVGCDYWNWKPVLFEEILKSKDNKIINFFKKLFKL